MDSFEDWYRLVYPRVVTTLSAAFGSADVAADASADAFVKAFQRWDRVGRMERPDGWVYRVALNAGRRDFSRRASEDAALTRAAAAPRRTEPAAEALDEFVSMVAGLPERMRQIVALRHVADLTESMIAEVLDVSRSTVSSTLRDAYQRLEAVVEVREDR